MYITKKHISRRAVLRGLGVSVALPLLDSMVPAQTPLAKTALNAKPHLTCIEMVHGAAGSTVDGSNKHYWSPAKEGADFEFTQILKPLEPFRDYVTVVTGTDLNPATAWVASKRAAIISGPARRSSPLATPR